MLIVKIFFHPGQLSHASHVRFYDRSTSTQLHVIVKEHIGNHYVLRDGTSILASGISLFRKSLPKCTTKNCQRTIVPT